MKVEDLDGALLDYWVAKAEGWDFFWSKHNYWSVTQPNGEQYVACSDWTQYDAYSGGKNKIPHPSEALDNFCPSADWAQGGPIIEREVIGFGTPISDLGYQAFLHKESGVVVAWGQTHLIAAMRVYVKSKFGDEAPDE
jgi:hypothetical protein